MTICSKMYEALDKKLEEQKKLRENKEYKPKLDEDGKPMDAIDEIGSELCDKVIDPRGKAIRLIKIGKGEQYLKDNAEWLGYTEYNKRDGSNQYSVQKNSDALEYQEVINDARSNGIRVDAPEYGMNTGVTIQSMQDEFEPDEVVYENKDAIIPQCKIFIPKKSDIKLCPCGCGYGYCEINEKWYSKNEIKNLSGE